MKQLLDVVDYELIRHFSLDVFDYDDDDDDVDDVDVYVYADV